MNWTEKEINLLKVKWPSATTEELLNSFSGRTYKAIAEKARGLKISANECRRRKGSLKYLDLDELTPEKAYWWGFIMADGHITKRGGLNIQISEKDFEHIKQLGDRLGVDIKLYKHNIQ